MGIVYWQLVEAQKNSLTAEEKAKKSPTMVYVSLMLFNPMVIGMSTRGSNDNIITLLVFLSIFCVLKKQYIVGGILYGLSVHFKIYPIIYCFVFYFFIDMDRKLIAEGKTFQAITSLKGFFTKDRLIFTFFSAGTFISLTGLFYYIYGYEFLYESYLYHFIRKDHRHNNSVYFYMIYQLFDDKSSALFAILTFIP